MISHFVYIVIFIFLWGFIMKKQTILTRAALLVAPFALAATFGTSVVSHADSDDDMVTTNVQGADNSAAAQAAHKHAESIGKDSDAQMAAIYQKQNGQTYNDGSSTDAPDKKTNTSSNTSKPAAKPATKTTAKKETTSTTVAKKAKPAKKAAKKHVVKKVTKKHAKKAAKKTTKKAKKVTKKRVAKKHVIKKHAKKHARRLFRIRVKARHIFAYRTLNFRHHHGRRLEKKGTKLYVYKVVSRHHRNYYKVYGGRVITSSSKYVTKISK